MRSLIFFLAISGVKATDPPLPVDQVAQSKSVVERFSSVFSVKSMKSVASTASEAATYAFDQGGRLRDTATHVLEKKARKVSKLAKNAGLGTAITKGGELVASSIKWATGGKVGKFVGDTLLSLPYVGPTLKAIKRKIPSASVEDPLGKLPTYPIEETVAGNVVLTFFEHVKYLQKDLEENGFKRDVVPQATVHGKHNPRYLTGKPVAYVLNQEKNEYERMEISTTNLYQKAIDPKTFRGISLVIDRTVHRVSANKVKQKEEVGEGVSQGFMNDIQDSFMHWILGSDIDALFHINHDGKLDIDLRARTPIWTFRVSVVDIGITIFPDTSAPNPELNMVVLINLDDMETLEDQLLLNSMKIANYVDSCLTVFYTDYRVYQATGEEMEANPHWVNGVDEEAEAQKWKDIEKGDFTNPPTADVITIRANQKKGKTVQLKYTYKGEEYQNRMRREIRETVAKVSFRILGQNNFALEMEGVRIVIGDIRGSAYRRPCIDAIRQARTRIHQEDFNADLGVSPPREWMMWWDVNGEQYSDFEYYVIEPTYEPYQRLVKEVNEMKNGNRIAAEAGIEDEEILKKAET